MQAITYRGIRRGITPKEQPTTNRNLDLTKRAILAFNETKETLQTIWKNIRKKTMHMKIQQFIFKAMHRTYRLGSYWDNIPECNYQKWCPVCNEMETMMHIITKCRATTTQTVWNLAKDQWPYGPERWPELSLGTILGCGSLTTMDRRGNTQGPTRLLQPEISLLEYAYLIWVLRCKRNIQCKEHTVREIKNRWFTQMNC
jgi:hypothetical protein